MELGGRHGGACAVVVWGLKAATRWLSHVSRSSLVLMRCGGSAPLRRPAPPSPVCGVQSGILSCVQARVEQSLTASMDPILFFFLMSSGYPPSPPPLHFTPPQPTAERREAAAASGEGRPGGAAAARSNDVVVARGVLQLHAETYAQGDHVAVLSPKSASPKYIGWICSINSKEVQIRDVRGTYVGTRGGGATGGVDGAGGARVRCV